MLELKNITVFRAQSKVLNEVSLVVRQSEMVALIGANGAGKSTLFESILGFHGLHAGSVLWDHQVISGLPVHQVATRGIAWVPEGRRLFADMTVRENLTLGAPRTLKPAAIKKNQDWIFSLFPILSQRLNQVVSTLSGGEQQMVAIGRALMAMPRLLLLDELSLGLSPQFTDEVFAVIAKIRSEGIGILLAEQNAVLALSHCDRAYVLENGTIAHEGPAQVILMNDSVRTAYLGL